MKFSKLLAISLTVASFFNPAQAESCLHKADIDKQSLLIETKIIRERYLVYGLTAITVAHEVYQWVPVLMKVLGKTPVGAPQAEDKTMFQAFKEGLKSFFYTKDGWVSVIHCGLSIGGFVLISKVGEKFVHPDTLHWYVNAYAPYTRTISMMQERLSMLQDPLLEQGSIIATDKEFLRTLYKRLIRQGRSICAYMAYKSRHLDGDDKVVARQAVISMFNAQNDWLSRIGAQLDADNQNYLAINNLLIAYGTDIAFQLNHFSLVEGETTQDRVAVRRQMKAAAADA
jgi:hypothetical protein